jgi:hypothetical protein
MARNVGFELFMGMHHGSVGTMLQSLQQLVHLTMYSLEIVSLVLSGSLADTLPSCDGTAACVLLPNSGSCDGTVLQAIQFTMTMFMTILVARGQRAVIDRNDQTKVLAFDVLLGVLLVIYPLINMGAHMLLASEIMLRRFMYYRLLSVQVSW